VGHTRSRFVWGRMPLYRLGPYPVDRVGNGRSVHLWGRSVSRLIWDPDLDSIEWERHPSDSIVWATRHSDSIVWESDQRRIVWEAELMIVSRITDSLAPAAKF